MKLYTEEQVIQAILNAYLQGIERHPEYLPIEQSILQELTPIKLPSDEEIAREASNEYQEQKQSYENSVEMFPIDFGNYLEVGFIEGAKWMRDKIKGGNNEP